MTTRSVHACVYTLMFCCFSLTKTRTMLWIKKFCALGLNTGQASVFWMPVTLHLYHLSRLNKPLEDNYTLLLGCVHLSKVPLNLTGNNILIHCLEQILLDTS